MNQISVHRVQKLYVGEPQQMVTTGGEVFFVQHVRAKSDVVRVEVCYYASTPDAMLKAHGEDIVGYDVHADVHNVKAMSIETAQRLDTGVWIMAIFANTDKGCSRFLLFANDQKTLDPEAKVKEEVAA